MGMERSGKKVVVPWPGGGVASHQNHAMLGVEPWQWRVDVDAKIRCHDSATPLACNFRPKLFRNWCRIGRVWSNWRESEAFGGVLCSFCSDRSWLRGKKNELSPHQYSLWEYLRVYSFLPCKVGRRRLSEPLIVFRVLKKIVWRIMTIDGGKNNLEKSNIYSASISFSMHRQSRKKKTRWASNLLRVLWRIVWSAVRIDGGKNSFKNNYWSGMTFCDYSAWNDFFMHQQSRTKKTRWTSNMFRVLWRFVWRAVSIAKGRGGLYSVALPTIPRSPFLP